MNELVDLDEHVDGHLQLRTAMISHVQESRRIVSPTRFGVGYTPAHRLVQEGIMKTWQPRYDTRTETAQRRMFGHPSHRQNDRL